MDGQRTVVPADEGIPLDLDTGLLCLVLVARYLGLPADADQLRRLFGTPGTPFADTEIFSGARSLGLKIGRLSSSLKRLEATPMPAIALLKDGHYVVLARVRDGQVMLQDPREPAPSVLPCESFGEAWSGGLILLVRRAFDPSSDRRFGFAWFIPALIRYRRFLAEVLVASLFLQIFALLAPLFTQVVIDKVLVHNASPPCTCCRWAC